MNDPVQASSSIPLPAYQTQQGTHDPLPISSPRALNQTLTDRAADDADDEAADFKAYLDRTSITKIEASKPKLDADPVELIAKGSVYAQPGVSAAL